MGKSKLAEPTHSEILDLLYEQSSEARVVTLRPPVRAADDEFGPLSYQAANARFGLASALKFSGEKVESEVWAKEALAIYGGLLEADPENPRYGTEEMFLRGMFGL